LLGIQALRNVIAHGLTDAAAHQFDQKVSRIVRAKLPTNPMKLTIKQIDRILQGEAAVTMLIRLVRTFRQSGGFQSP
jgi:hypothetical protein